MHVCAPQQPSEMVRPFAGLQCHVLACMRCVPQSLQANTLCAPAQATLGQLQAMLEQSEAELAGLLADGRGLAAEQLAVDKAAVAVQQDIQVRSHSTERHCPLLQPASTNHVLMPWNRPQSQSAKSSLLSKATDGSRPDFRMLIWWGHRDTGFAPQEAERQLLGLLGEQTASALEARSAVGRHQGAEGASGRAACHGCPCPRRPLADAAGDVQGRGQHVCVPVLVCFPSWRTAVVWPPPSGT